MRFGGRRGAVILVAALTAAALFALSLIALVSSGGAPERSGGLDERFSSVDADYQRATQAFLDKAEDAKDAPLAETLRLLTDVLEVVKRTRSDLGQLDSVPETERPIERLDKSLQVEALALQEAIDAARRQDADGVTDASEKYQTAVLAYQVAKSQMQAALDECGDRCR